jgi:predicted DCC family thiol-disulfide oxidoreductase YuxK
LQDESRLTIILCPELDRSNLGELAYFLHSKSTFQINLSNFGEIGNNVIYLVIQLPAIEKMYQNLILFDGVCNFCNAAVQMIIEIDRQKIFKFAAIQSELGQKLYYQHGLDLIDIQTLMFVDGDRVLTQSDAVLAVLSRLDGGWQLLGGFTVMPKPWRDWAYSEFARQRFRLFGRRDACIITTPELQERFIG